jgi:LysM repeat protein
MSAVKNLSLGNVVKIALPIVAVTIIGVLLLAACSQLGIGRSSSQGIPTPAAQAVVNNAAPPAAPAPENKDAAAQPAPAPTAAPAANPQPAAVIPTVQPAIVNEQGEVVINAGGQQQPVANDAQPQQGISPAPAIAEAPADLACGQRVTHIVAPGETVFSIARRYRSTTYSVARINRIANTRSLAVGRRLVVVTCDRSGGASAGGRRYVVRAGDNLYRIGLRFGTSAERIRIANGLPTYTISVGQVLVIP